MVESPSSSPLFAPVHRHWRVVAAVLGSTLAVAAIVAFSLHHSPAELPKTPLPAWTSAHTPTEAVRGSTTTPTTTPPPASAPLSTNTPTPTPTPAMVIAAPVPAPAAVVQPVVVAPPIASLVAEVESAGIEPGSNWSWSVGDTAARCGPISGSGTGCTFGSGGLEYTVFAGSPNLSLVAHELANAETQNDAVPTLLNEVAAAEGGTSWSPTDAVASCLVAHFLGFQDDAAGTWTCSPAVAAFVADNIHDTLLTTVGTLPG
jgi:hypothetical protein